MFFAVDKDGNRIHAEDGVFSGCKCPACGCPVIQKKKGDYRSIHFAHDYRYRDDVKCPYDYNKDYINMSDWHKRMQGFFPKECREVIFPDTEKEEKHIADVYLEENKTVLEFQYSYIDRQEFLDRTNFHIKEGRRIAWVFFEGEKKKKEEVNSKWESGNIKLKKSMYKKAKEPYVMRCFQWNNKRNVVEDGPEVYQPNYSVWLYTGKETDTDYVLHRIVYQDKKDCRQIILSLHDITMSSDIDVEEFFYDETHWNDDELWDGEFVKRATSILSRFKDDEERRRYLEYKDVGTILAEGAKKRAQEREDHEDYLNALLADAEAIDQRRKK